MNLITKLLVILTLVLGKSISAKADTIDNYQVLVKDSVILSENNLNPFSSTIKIVTLALPNYNDTITIYYNHCTKGAQDRRIELRDTANKMIMEWKFPAENDKQAMNIPIKNILTNEKVNANNTFSLYYFDDSITKGKFLAPVKIGDIPNRKIAEHANRRGQSNKLLFLELGATALLLAIVVMLWRRRSAKTI